MLKYSGQPRAKHSVGHGDDSDGREFPADHSPRRFQQQQHHDGPEQSIRLRRIRIAQLAKDAIPMIDHIGRDRQDDHRRYAVDGQVKRIARPTKRKGQEDNRRGKAHMQRALRDGIERTHIGRIDVENGENHADYGDDSLPALWKDRPLMRILESRIERFVGLRHYFSSGGTTASGILMPRSV